jgi:hypothetical protein
MSLSDFASIASLVSGIAVLVSLVYLSQQIRQATKHTRAQIGTMRTQRVVDMSYHLIDPTVATLIARGRAGDRSLNAGELMGFMAFARAQFWSAEDTFIQHEEGLIGDAIFDTSFRSNFVGLLQGPGMRAAWRLQRGNFEPGFAAYMDGIAAEGAALAGGSDFVAAWGASLDAEEERQ